MSKIKVTSIKEIAQLAGVGISTVSRVINNKSDVKAETKEKVNAIIKKYHFEPNTNARNLKQINSKTICIIVKGTFNLFFSRIIEIMQSKIEENELTPFVRYIDETDDEIVVAKRLINEKKAIGIIFLGGGAVSVEEISENPDIPFVFATTSAKDVDFNNVSSVCVDDMLAAKNAVDYLFDNGHEKIAMIGGKLEKHSLVSLRYDGVMQSFKEHGISFDKDLYVESKFSLVDSYTAMSHFIAQKKFTAVFAMSDIMAIGAAKAIFDAGLKVPQDISIIGFDGIDMAYFYNPTLATIRQPSDEIAIKSVELLIANIKKKKIQNKHITLNFSVIEGNSVSKISK